MKERLFRFKRFEVNHSRSAMPIGVDGVLIGCWAECEGRRILEVGTGCGVIALIMAQRYEESFIEAIDIHLPSVEEAKGNFENSPWSDRLVCRHESFEDIDGSKGKYDLIVSNPPYYDSGVGMLETPRLAARHVGLLSPASLIVHSRSLLSQTGRLAMIIPADIGDKIIAYAESQGYGLSRACCVRDHDGAEFKRIMIELSLSRHMEKDDACFPGSDIMGGRADAEKLTMFEADKSPTDKYRRLCGEFYLKF